MLRAQGSFPFQLVVQQGSTAQNISNGTALNIAANGVNQGVQLGLLVTNNGSAPATFSTPQLIGDTTDFTVTLNAPSPIVQPGNTTAFTISFTPSKTTQVSALLTIPYTLNPASGSSSTGSISLTLNGTTPAFIFSYTVPPLSNATLVTNGQTIPFPATALGSSVNGTFSITNNGTAAGSITAIAVSGAAFQVQSLPLLPGNLAAGQTLNIAIVYKPTGAQTDSGTLTITLPSQTITINLTGSSTSALLQYTLTVGGKSSTITAGQTITLPDTNVATSSTASITLTNTGNSTATITPIGIAGQAFQLTSAPAVPLSLAPAATATITFTFTPPQSGTFSGTLQVGSDSFPLTGKGLGASYTYSYAAGSTTVPVVANGGVFFPPTQVGQSASTTFTITNGGTSSGAISSIFVGAANSPFSLSGLPPLPVAVAAGQSITFQITFTPTAAGAASDALHLDGTQFALSGPGNPPPTLPSYSFTGASGTQAPLQQTAVGLSLASAYPVGITGTLTMNVVPQGISADPAIQFATGGRTANFTIPANTLNAVFPDGSSSIKLQTGSTAGTITLVPAFQTSGGGQLTPSNPPALQLAVPPVAPILTGAQVVSETASTVSGGSSASITLAISGVTNSQNLDHIDFTFTPAANYSLSSTSLSIQVSSVATTWFQSTAGQGFGGQFTAAVPLTLSSGSGGKTLLNAIASISVTASNAQGTSTPVTVALQ